MLKIAAGNVFHGVIKSAVGERAAVEHLDDIGMIATREQAHLAAKSGERDLVAGEIGGKHLQGDQAAEAR